jgi:hypothetical protein
MKLYQTPAEINGQYFNIKKVKVKDSRYRPGVAQRVPAGLGS